MGMLNEEYIEFLDKQAEKKGAFYSFEDWKMHYNKV